MRFIISFWIGTLLIVSCNSTQEHQKKSSEPSNSIHLTTSWAKEVNAANVHSEYPRPQMTRNEWINLNGLWDYAILPKSRPTMDSVQGKILVPFPVESYLSGVTKRLSQEELLWYQRKISIPGDWNGKRILLHFEAVDWKTAVWIDGKSVGIHEGGYDPFSFEITDFVESDKNHQLTVAVWDPTDIGHFNPRGKQVSNPSGIYYTPSSGIWQTVWIEAVPEMHISAFKIETDIDKGSVSFEVETSKKPDNQLVMVGIRNWNDQLRIAKGNPGTPFSLFLENPILWSPDNPHLYEVTIRLQENGRTLDEVKSYFGMRKIALGKDKEGHTRIFLNNKFVFQNGPLDQGFWPDGLYTPPSDEALNYDIEMTKRLGFNMLRKHVKVESRRFYYWCDKLGILVWQDMPNAPGYVGPGQPDIRVSKAHDKNFKHELGEMIHTLYNHPSIVIWVPFNEGWGQYDSQGILDFTKKMDPTRLVILASGWQDRGIGDIYDIHNYPEPIMPQKDENRAIVLGEFGGLGFPVENHLWTKQNWGYKKFQDLEEMTLEYERFYSRVWNLMENGLSASVYTQITDVETETNGLLTYDRKILKMNEHVLKAINSNDFTSAPQMIPFEKVFNRSFNVSLTQNNREKIYYTLDGSEPGIKSTLYEGLIPISNTTTVRAIAISADGKPSMTVSRTFEKTDQKEPKYVTNYEAKYSGGGKFGLVDGINGSENYGDGKWQGFHGVPMEVVFENESIKKIKSVAMNFLEHQAAWIFLPNSILFYGSQNGSDFEKIQMKELTLQKVEDVKIHSISFNVNQKQNFKFYKIKAWNSGICPEWHPGNGNKSWIFIDEVVFNN